MKKLICQLFTIIISLTFSGFVKINLENNAQDYVLETKQIIIPEYPDAFNASIVRWKGELWMSFRFFPDPKDIWVANIGIVKLNELFEPIGKTHILNCLDRSETITHSLEDARLISSEDRLYIVYNDHKEPQKRWVRRVFFAELVFDNENFQCLNLEGFMHFDGENSSCQEKNWTPFDYQGEILFSYSLLPHIIMKPLLGLETCTTIFKSKGKINWNSNFGEPRGGSQAILLDDEYFAFFHSSCNAKTKYARSKMKHYFMGAYTFSSKPPFSITRISEKPIVANNFYLTQYKYYWGPRRVIYPCGCIADENFIWVSFGREDREIWVAKMDRKKLLDTLVPVLADHKDP